MRLIDADVLMEPLKEDRDFHKQMLDDKSTHKDDAKISGAYYSVFSKVYRMVKNAPTVCKWHDPDEELPKKDGEYLCLTRVHTIPPHWRTDVYRWNKSNFWWNDSEWGEGIADDVCYWMEIPPMPEIGGEEDAENTDGKADS